MIKHVSKGVYKRVSIMDYFTTRKRKIFLDKKHFCNKCQLERLNNRTEGCYVFTNCGECEFVFPAVNYRDIPSRRIKKYSYIKNKPSESEIEAISSNRRRDCARKSASSWKHLRVKLTSSNQHLYSKNEV